MRMKMLRNNCTILLAALALLLLPWASAGKSLAYFTTWEYGRGALLCPRESFCRRAD